MRGRRLFVSGATLAALALSGCAVPVTGVTGMTRTSGGSLSAVVSMCEGTVHSAAISYVDASDHSQFLSEWRYPTAVAEHGIVALMPDPTGQLQAGVSYSLDSWSSDNNAVAYGPEFTVTDLESLAVGEVLSLDFRRDGAPFSAVLTEAEFTDSVRSFCEDQS